MQAILIAIELLVAVALIVTVLLQRSEGGALGMGGGGSGLGGLFSPRGAADTLTRATTLLGALFFITCLGLNVLALHGRDEKSFLEAPAAPPPASKPLFPAAPAKPALPTPH
ncbi:MAG: preprotein translocase subunit SecG [Rhizomicrobium sp.]